MSTIPHMIPNHTHSSTQSPPSLFSLITKVAGLLLVFNLISAAGMAAMPQATTALVAQTTYQAKPDAEPGIQECVITLLSGRRVTGELIRQDALIVVIGINGINTTFQRDQLIAIKILPPVAKRFAQMRAAIDDNDIEARLTLIEWLRIRKAYTLAIKELESVLIQSPNNHRAKLLYTWLTEYNKLGPPSTKDDTDSTTPKSTRRKTKRPSRSQVARQNEIPPLTKEQINLMRVYEIDLRDPPKIRVPDETLTILMSRNPKAFSPNEDDRKAIFKLPEIEKLKLLFTHKARDLYVEVVVLEDPTAMKLFKDDVHSRRGWIINTCASTRCHGGTNAGPFQLINTRLNSNETAYTNLYIIEHYTLADGGSLIDFEDPQRSPLLQMAMIEKNSLKPHPVIPRDYPGMGFRPIFKSTRDRNYRDAVDWIRSMYQPRPEYEFERMIQPEPKPVQTAP